MNLSAIVVPRGRLPRKIQKEGQQPSKLRRMASTSAPPKRMLCFYQSTLNEFCFLTTPGRRHF